MQSQSDLPNLNQALSLFYWAGLLKRRNLNRDDWGILSSHPSERNQNSAGTQQHTLPCIILKVLTWDRIVREYHQDLPRLNKPICSSLPNSLSTVSKIFSVILPVTFATQKFNPSSCSICVDCSYFLDIPLLLFWPPLRRPVHWRWNELIKKQIYLQILLHQALQGFH